MLTDTLNTFCNAWKVVPAVTVCSMGILNKYRGELKQQLTIVLNKLYVLQRRGGKMLLRELKS